YIPGMEVNGKRVLLPGNKDDAVYGRHINKTVNIGYVDSHIKRLRADKLFITEVKNIYTSGFQF
ncbi:MAG: hypothetical protein JXK07_16725, partial [Spirochaetes bacterium]|nr:hypothetical protein [Spirochaetota bacterium]